MSDDTVVDGPGGPPGDRPQDQHAPDRTEPTKEHPVEQQRRLGDRYEVGELLGRGGMAEVHRGRDLRLGREVAIKSLRVDLARDSSFQTRFRREAQSAASLNHPNVVAVYDTGEEINESGVAVPFIVMERVQGTTLRDLLASGRRLLPERALEITSSVLEALEYSHGRGIVHRDIKPANVMLTDGGEVKVMDFGIARAVADTQSTMTQTGATLGTAQYLSPEQAQGGHVDQRSDIYSAGCMLYELLTGRPPFVGDSPVSVAYQHVRENPLPPSQVDADVSPDVDAIVMKALAKNPDNRYQSAAEMREDIARLLAGRPVAATPLAEETRAITTVAPVAQDVVVRGSNRRKVVGFALLGLLVAAVLVAGIVALLTSGGAKQVAVPDLVGLQEREAINELEEAGLSLGERTEEPSDLEAGIVIRQSPAFPGTVDEGGSVDIVVSAGPEQVKVPAIVGMSLDDARDALEEAGLVLGRTEQRPSDRPENEVLEAKPKPGRSVDKGEVVDVVISSGKIEVPDVVGMTEDEAVQALQDAGLRVRRGRQFSEEFAPGTVMAQTPDGGDEVAPSTVVTLTIAVAPPVIDVPTVTETVTAVPTDTATETPVTPTP